MSFGATAVFAAGFVGAGWPLVAVRADDIPVPRRGADIRTDGLWASVTEDSVSMEAFGAVFEDPLVAWGDERGEIVPFGLDLQWSAGMCLGEVLVGTDRIEVDCPGFLEPLVGIPGYVKWVAPVKPSTVHALSFTPGGWRWVSWYEQTSLPPGSPG